MKPLMDKKNVVGVAEGEKWINGKSTGQKAILVFVEQKEPLSDLDPDDIIEDIIDGLPTDVVGKSGSFTAMITPAQRKRAKAIARARARARARAKAKARAKARARARVKRAKAITRARARAKAIALAKARAKARARARARAKAKARAKARGKVYKLNPRTYNRPIIGGLSISHRKVTAGTIGAIFKDKKKRIVALSNNHVLANENNAKKGDVIYQPGTYDNSPKPRNVIGYLADFVPLRNGVNQDSAIAIIKKPYLPTINKIGKPAGGAAARVGLSVMKSGRTTGLTKGRVIGTNGRFKVSYGVRSYIITNCIITTDMSKGGDSGSLLLDTKRRAVGLLFAGSNTMTLHNPIGPVMKRYGLSFL